MQAGLADNSENLLFPLGSKLLEQVSIINAYPFFYKPTLIVKPKYIDEVEDNFFPFGGRGPTGDWVNSLTNFPSIHVWQAMLFPSATIMPRLIERSSNAVRIDLK